jgi:capsular exopolysaccharide synthesis family protein
MGSVQVTLPVGTALTNGALPQQPSPAGEVWALLKRKAWLILACTVVAIAAAIAYVVNATRVYEASTSLRIDVKEANLPEVFHTLSTGTEVVTEMEVLGSRTLVEDATRALSLQLRLVHPRGMTRASLIRDIRIGPNPKPGVYRLLRQPDGSRVIASRVVEKGPWALLGARWVLAGRTDTTGQVQLPDLAFTLTPAAIHVPEIEIVVRSFAQAVDDIVIDVSQANREGNVVTVRYRDTDRDLVWRVPNVIAQRFIERRQEGLEAEAGSTVKFLRTQIDTLSHQLASAEDAFRRFRERQQVVNPQEEGTQQVSRLVTLQSERGSIDAERLALARTMAEVRASAAHLKPGEPSPYRRLLAFPTLLRNQTATELLHSLATAEDQRTGLLARRTLEDPDVKVLSARIAAIEDQLRGIVETYLDGLTNQVASYDSTLKQFGSQLSQVPGRELEYARLDRQTKVLEQMYTLLQTRLKEAEIAQASHDPSVLVIDAAIPPIDPVKPRRKLVLLAGFMGGLLAGVGLAFAREYLDRSVHTRADVSAVTGLPVMGLIPRIEGSRNGVTLISEVKRIPARTASRPVRSRTVPEWKPPDPSPPVRGGWSLWPTPEAPPPPPRRVEPAAEAEPEPEPAGEPTGVPASIQLLLPVAGSPAVEAYGTLQTNLAFAREDRPVRTVVFTSPLPGDGKTTSAVNFAVSLAQRGQRVLLADGDLRRGLIHKIFETEREPGLADVLTGDAAWRNVIRAVDVGGGRALHFMPSGTPPAIPSATLQSDMLHALLVGLAEHYDAIVIDSPPINVVADAALLGVHADGVVIVARAGVTESAALGYAMEQLRRVHAPVLGVVLNDIDFRRDAAYDRAYQYYSYRQYHGATEGV